MKKTLITVLTGTLFIIWGILLFTQCKDDNSKTDGDQQPLPLNITVFLDLSDRLVKNGTSNNHDSTTQMTRDTTIIRQLEDIFISESVKNNGIINSQNHFQVVFYPTPNSSQINVLAENLNVDLSKAKAKEKRKMLNEMKPKFSEALGAIYDQTIKDSNWTGCDIWGFFSNKKVDQICVRDGYRNVLVILTDGYLYHVNNKIKKGTAYSYILDKTLATDDATLLVKRQGLDNLEVLMLEINPTDPKNMTKMTSTLEAWFKEMGVKHFVVADTDIPQNITPVIDSFFGERQ